MMHHILKRFEDDEKLLNENVDGIVKINQDYVKDDKTPVTILTDWDENIVIAVSMIIS